MHSYGIAIEPLGLSNSKTAVPMVCGTEVRFGAHECRRWGIWV